ncbi:unnamed protein product [Boreogadus saida]
MELWEAPQPSDGGVGEPSLVMEVREAPQPSDGGEGSPQPSDGGEGEPSLVMEVREAPQPSDGDAAELAVLLYRQVDDGRAVNRASGGDHQTAAPRVPAVQRRAGPVHGLLLSGAHRRWSPSGQTSQ